MRYFLLYIISILIPLISFSQEITIIDSTLIDKVDSLNTESVKLTHSSPSKGLLLSNDALKISRDIKYKKGEAISLNYIGRHYYNLAEYDESQRVNHKALDIFKEIKFNKGIGISLESLSLIYSNIENYKQAIDYLYEAIEIYKKDKDSIAIAFALSSIAIVYENQKLNQKALDYNKRALSIFENLNNKAQTARIHINIANNYYSIKDFKKAFINYKEAETIYKELNDTFGQIISYTSLGRLYTAEGKYNMAETSLISAYNLSKAIERNPKQEYLLKCMYELYLAKKDYKKALEFYTVYQEKMNNILSSTNSQKIEYAKEKYNYELKEKENMFLVSKQKQDKKQIRIRNTLIIVIILSAFLISFSLFKRIKQKRRANKELIKQKNELKELVEKLNIINREKDGLLSILSHDLKNPFNVILGLLDALKEDWEDLEKEEIKEYMSRVSSASNSAYTLLEDILTWSRSQTDGIKLAIDKMNLLVLCTKSIEVLMPAANRKQISIEININKDIRVNIDRFTISTVIANITSNSIKFTPESGSISLSSEVRDNFILLIIKDTGIGMPKSKLNQLFQLDKSNSTLGTNNEKGTGLGLLICNEFVKLNKGSIRVESEVGKGSTFIISLPKV